jgi:Protein of unknown function (DUF2628)
MARYTVHVPGKPDVRAEALERAVFVRDGWSWGAAFFGPFWLLWNRHWITGVLAFVLMAAVFATLAVLPLGEAAKAGAILLLMGLWGLEGSSLRRFAMARAGYTEEGLVVGGDLDALEQRFFAEMTGHAPISVNTAPAAAPSGVTPSRGASVIGLFPDSRKPS